jgi:hypothetical protein
MYEFITLLLHVSVTFCGHVQGGVYIEEYITNTTKPMHSYEILSFKYVIHNIC